MAYSGPEPLRGKHNLDRFCSGEESLDGWLRRQARNAEATGSARVFVTTEDGTHVVGYYALAAGSVEPADATVRLMKGQPAERSVPVVILARLAVDGHHQGIGLGESLLQNALLRTVEAAEAIGVRAVIVHALNRTVAAWYQRYGFEASPTDPLHQILLVKDLRKLLAEFD
jgi:predicted N-acetyltransferase YhbS